MRMPRSKSPISSSRKKLSADLALASRLADAAGAAIRPYFRADFGLEMKADATPVTLADRAAEAAIAEKRAFILYVSSGGARMQESMLSLMQMPRTTIAVQMLKEAGLPYIVVFTDPTFGGVSASYAMLGDIQIAEPGAQIGFAGARVIAQTIREKLPEGFQRAEYLLAHGMLDMVLPRAEMRPTLSRVLHMLLKKPRPKARTLPPPTLNGNGRAAAAQ